MEKLKKNGGPYTCRGVEDRGPVQFCPENILSRLAVDADVQKLLAAEKTKTQAENSSQKLKEKTQLQGGTFLFFKKKLIKTEKFSGATTTFNAIFVGKYFQFHMIYITNIEIFRRFKKA